jgi:hypothetical protein
MAESDSILQLGIEAARDGNREEARNLFRLLTRQDPKNAQAWLWLAGVAENREERQAALERVVELEPTNEMGVKGLQALGVRPTVRINNDTPSTAPPVAPVDPILPPSEPEPVAEFTPAGPTPEEQAAANRARFDVDDDDPFAALDSLSEAMETSPGAVRRADAGDEYDDLDALSTAINDDADANTTPRRAARASSSGRFSSSPGRTSFEEEDDTEPQRRGLSPLLIGLIGLIVLALIALLAWRLFLRGDETAGTGTVGTPTELATPATDATDVLGGTGVITGTGTVTDTGAVGGTGVITDTGAVTGTGEAAPPAPAEATPAPPAAPGGDLASAQPAIVPANSPLESNGWLYDFNRPTYAAPIAGGLGNVQPQQGRFVVVLIFLANNTGTAQAIPGDFFVMKDAQGRVYAASPEASNAYVQRGVNADLSQTDAIPADGLTRSVALIFDVAPDARDLVFFARSKTDQGWLVLNSVQ